MQGTDTGTAPMEDSEGRDNMYGSWGMILD